MLRLVGYPTIVVSSVGLVASLLIILAAFTGWRDSGAVVSIAMSLIIVISMLVMILVMNSGFENLSQRQVMKLVQESCPKWMQVGGKGLLLLGVLAFLGAAIENGMAEASDFEGFPALFLGGFGTVIHSQAIVSIYGAMQLQENLARSQCKFGHQIPLGAKFCPECGEKASPDSQPI
jgi:hypothetical protein